MIARFVANEVRPDLLWTFGLTAALPAVSQIAWAKAYPKRPMTMVVPYSAGGPSDTIARIMAERMRISLGQIIIVENTTGAAGTIGVGRVARANPDGYTISIGHWGTHVQWGDLRTAVPCVQRL
jgi:tripartite-type tricarboxylate transporter receptor subunit TctC